MAKKNNKKSSVQYDWNELIIDLSKIIDEPKVCKRLFNHELEGHPEIKDFQDQFIKQVKVFGLPEREEYYRETGFDKGYMETMMDEYGELFRNEVDFENYPPDDFFGFVSCFGAMVKWLQENHKNFKITKLWSMSFSEQKVGIFLNETQRFYLFHKCIEYDLIGGIQTGFYTSYGDRLLRLLSLIMDVPEKSLDGILKNLKNDEIFPTVQKITENNKKEKPADIGKRLKSIEKIISAYEFTKLDKEGIKINDRNLMSYLTDLKNDYEQALGKNNYIIKK